MLTAEIISIGNELLSGFTENTNASWLGRKCRDLGVAVQRIITIPDVENEIANSITDAAKRADFVIITGGLGPTHDDLTKATIAKVAKMDLIFRKDLLDEIRTRFESRGIKMPETNREQAMVLSGAKVIPNPVGTAPGFDFLMESAQFFVLPGVPSEMKTMFKNYCIKMIANAKSESPKVLFVRTTGIAESRLSEILGDISTYFSGVKMAYLPKHTGVDLRFELTDSSGKIFNSIKQTLEEKIGKFIYAWKDKTLAQTIVELLQNRNQTLSVAESCTGGMIASQIVDIAGASDIFKLGVVSYHNDAKEDILQVPEKLLLQFGAVSAEVAEEMAVNVRMRGGTHFGLSVTGIAGPSGGSHEKPVGLVYIGLAHSENCEVKQFQFGNHRKRIRERATQQALNLIRLHCLSNG